MLVLFCEDPLSPREVDSMFADEAAAARASGHDVVLVGFEALVQERDAARAVRRVPEGETREAVYRGWMLKAEAYARLHAALLARGVRLVHSPEQYRYAHHLPEWYPDLADHTPRSAWVPVRGTPDFQAILETARSFGHRPIVVKDYVKSRKHEWAEACFVHDASDVSRVQSVVLRLLELQGDDLNEGVVLREYVELEERGVHPQSGMPLAREFRIFYFDGRRIGPFGYWGREDELPPTEALERIDLLAKRVRARFFSMDIARTKGGAWMVIEVGDGQVSGLPEGADPRAFYGAL